MEENSITENKVISFDEQIKETEIEKKLSIPAKRLMEKLEPIPSKIESLQFRWIWELIQNASDFNTEVDVELTLNENSLIFSHNGQPFKLVDVENLITPDSDKDDVDLDEDYIGRFGSGFIATHALSAVITVEGLVKDNYRDNTYYQFKFNLDRSDYASKPQLIKSIEASEIQFKSEYSSSIHTEGKFETKFTYDLTRGITNTEPKVVAKNGIEYAIKVLPYVFCFLPKLKSVKFIHPNANISKLYFYQKNRNNEIGKLEIGISKNDIPEDDIIIRYAEEETSTVAVESKDGMVIGYPENMAILFLSLPMIGSERFPFPVAINSSKFKPETERHAINLSDNDIINRTILTNGVIAYKKLLEILSKESIGNLYHLVALKSDRIKALPLGSDWFQKNIESQFKVVFDEVDFVNCNGSPISYLQLKLPFIPENKSDVKDLDFYDTVYELIVDTTPSRNDYLKWLKNIDFTIFKSIPFRLEAAVKLVDETKNLTGLSLILKKNDEQTVDWLAKLIKYVMEHENGLLNKYSIIPNKSENGDFVNRDSEIFVDAGVDLELIEVFDKMKKQRYKDRLLNDTIKLKVENLLPSTKLRDLKDIAKEIDDIFRDRLDGNSRLSKDELEGLSLLLGWLKKKGFPDWQELNQYFPTFSISYSNFFLESFDEQEKVKAITIRDSGKQDSLVKLAESEITETELDIVIENISDVKEIVNIIDSGANITKLGELARLFSNDIPEKVISFAQEIARQKKEFSNLLNVGSKVEELFIDTLIAYDVNSNREDIIHAGGGAYDIRIYNPETQKSFYIELKSCRNGNTDPISLAVSQIKKAVKEVEKGTFGIVVIERTSDNIMDIEYIRANTKYLKNPGAHLSEIDINYDLIEKSANTNNEIDLKMENAEFKGAMDYQWLNKMVIGSGFDNLVEDIKLSIG